jgi:anti-sigma B factor antagonist
VKGVCPFQDTGGIVPRNRTFLQEKKMLNIKKTIENEALTVFLEGRLDTVTAPELESALQESLADVNSLILDFEGLDYISSAGLRVLLSTEKQMMAKDGMKVRKVNEPIMEIFEVTGFSEILTIE